MSTFFIRKKDIKGGPFFDEPFTSAGVADIIEVPDPHVALAFAVETVDDPTFKQIGEEELPFLVGESLLMSEKIPLTIEEKTMFIFHISA